MIRALPPPSTTRATRSVAEATDLDRYTTQTIARPDHGNRTLADQPDDGFYANSQSIFALLQLRDTANGANPAEDSQGGFNVHTMALKIPINDIGGDHKIVSVCATTSRRQFTRLRGDPGRGPRV